MDGVVYDVPVPNDTPPDDAAYQLRVPAEAVAPKATVPVPHRLPGVLPVMVGVVFMVTVGVTDICEVQPVAVMVANTLKVVVPESAPVGRLMLPPVPVTGVPMVLLLALFLSW